MPGWYKSWMNFVGLLSLVEMVLLFGVNAIATGIFVAFNAMFCFWCANRRR